MIAAAAGIVELPQQFLLLCAESLGNFHHYRNVHIPPIFGIDHLHALVFQCKGRARLGSFGNIQGFIAIDGGNLQGGT